MNILSENYIVGSTAEMKFCNVLF